MSKQLDLFTAKFKLTEVGLEVEGKPDFEECMDYGQSLKILDGTVRQFAVGDWGNLVHERYEHNYLDAAEQIWGNDKETLRKYEWVSKHIKSVLRRTDLSFSHHEVIAALDSDKQSYWLEQAVSNKWSVATLRQKLSEKNYIHLIHGDMLEVVPGLGKFDLVVTDPPYGVTDYAWDVLHTEEWLKVIIPHLADEYNLFWFCSPTYAADIELTFRSLGISIQSRIVWIRRNMALGSKAKNKFVDTWEMILHAGNRELNFPSDWSEAWFDTQEFAVPQSNFGDKKVHPTQKPEGLIQRLVEFGSYKGDHILDPFAGSCTTGLVCPDDRDVTLIEREDGYVGISEVRLGVKRQ